MQIMNNHINLLLSLTHISNRLEKNMGEGDDCEKHKKD